MPRHTESKQRLVRHEYLLPEVIFVSSEGLASSQWYLGAFQKQTMAYLVQISHFCAYSILHFILVISISYSNVPLLL